MNGFPSALRNTSLLAMLISLSLGGALTTQAQETDQNMPVGAVGGTVHADPFTGTATTSIPIDVPPGRQGIQPDLALVYGSSNGNGWLGMGWKLEKGVIERQTKMGVDYSGDDYVFRLSGINVELVNIGNDEYRAKIEGGFTRIEKLTATDGKPYFKATDKTGKTFIFGSVPDTRVADPNDVTKIFRWCLERVEDVHGNYMTLSYTTDQGQAYLSQIDYTGHGSTAPSNSVIFHLEDRSDDAPMYVPNFEMTTAKRLKTIEVQANGTVIRAYKLSYIENTTTQHSLLQQMQQYGKDAVIDSTGTVTGGTTLPAVTSTFAGGDTGFMSTFFGPTWSDAESWNRPEYYGTIQYPDVDGDGKSDICARNQGGILCIVGTGIGFSGSIIGPPWSDATGWTAHQNFSTIRFPDLNGNGKADLCGKASSGLECWISTGTAFTSSFTGPPHYSAASWGDHQYYSTIKFPDLDGDGKADVCARDSGGLECWIGTGTGFTAPFNGPRWSDNSGWDVPKYYATISFADLNGDGKADVCARDSGGIECWIGTGASFTTPFNGPRWSDAD
ncbi:MAG: SpvB/TcaC N-terminal domain-containing protein, partial [Nitrospirales bacterium]